MVGYVNTENSPWLQVSVHRIVWMIAPFAIPRPRGMPNAGFALRRRFQMAPRRIAAAIGCTGLHPPVPLRLCDQGRVCNRARRAVAAREGRLPGDLRSVRQGDLRGIRRGQLAIAIAVPDRPEHTTLTRSIPTYQSWITPTTPPVPTPKPQLKKLRSPQKHRRRLEF